MEFVTSTPTHLKAFVSLAIFFSPLWKSSFDQQDDTRKVDQFVSLWQRFAEDFYERRIIWTVFNFINILRAAFAPIFFQQKITKANCSVREILCKALSFEKAAGKMLMKSTPGPCFVVMDSGVYNELIDHWVD